MLKPLKCPPQHQGGNFVKISICLEVAGTAVVVSKYMLNE